MLANLRRKSKWVSPQEQESETWGATLNHLYRPKIKSATRAVNRINMVHDLEKVVYGRDVFAKLPIPLRLEGA